MNQTIQKAADWLRAGRNRVWLAAAALGTAVTILIAGITGLAAQEQEQLQESFFRFHVLANSDSPEDQALKLQVRDAVIDYLEPQLRQFTSKEEAKAYITEHLPQITDVAGRTLRAAGSSQSVKAVVGVSDFPTKSYGSVTLPAGRYDSLRIEIGAAQGHNWWCVMFPTLCFVEETNPDEMEEELALYLPQEQNELIHQPKQFRFKLVEWYHALFD